MELKKMMMMVIIALRRLLFGRLEWTRNRLEVNVESQRERERECVSL